MAMSKRSSVMLRGTIHTLVGGVGATFFGLILLALAVNRAPLNVGFIIVSGLFFGCSYLFSFGLKNKKLAGKVRKYIPLIVNENITSIDTIGSSLKVTSTEVAINEIDNLIQLGFLPGFVIDRANRLVARPQAQEQQRQQTQQINQTSTKSEIKVFSCRACGANNAVMPIGGVARCEYCDVAV